ncbi:hypothetical protein HII36_23910 [Nonomuraea sp. NN258]|uniref:hypothetical protein n=1 Tax=Nonomuraea antri TaxID=2730852 RepID=UPI00156908D7|nr:hypothetical protein [Nonomuraea antri]NRQ34854.1 hypothetical protein [Nonomuraea antri]
MVSDRGGVSDADLKAAREEGLSDGEIAEVVANVALNVFTNYIDTTADTDIDWPVVRHDSWVISSIPRNFHVIRWGVPLLGRNGSGTCRLVLRTERAANRACARSRSSIVSAPEVLNRTIS